MKTQNTTIRNSFLLLLTATVWGFAFVAQRVGMDFVGPYTFNAVRNMLGFLVLLPFIGFLDHKKKEGNNVIEKTQKDKKMLLIAGIVCGSFLFLAGSFQQIGIQYTTVGKAGFLTACYIIIVPVIGLFLKKSCSPFIWLAVILALAGLYLLCITESFHIEYGDLLELICAVLFSVHILVIDYFSPKVDGVKLASIQFLVCSVLSGIAAVFTESISMEGIWGARIAILYAGILSCGVGYTLQIIGQKDMNPTVASLIMSLESSISVLAGWLLLGQKLSVRELLGCLLMVGAIVLAQLPEQEKGEKDEKNR